MYIKWENPSLNQKVKHINLTLSSPFTRYVPYSNFEVFNIVTQSNQLCSITHYFNSDFVTNDKDRLLEKVVMFLRLFHTWFDKMYFYKWLQEKV